MTRKVGRTADTRRGRSRRRNAPRGQEPERGQASTALPCPAAFVAPGGHRGIARP